MSKKNKYLRRIYSAVSAASIEVDVYSVINAFDVKCPARQHAIKKLLCAGLRGKGDCLQDLAESREAIDRAIQMEEVRIQESLEEL